MRPLTLIHLSDLHVHRLAFHPRHWGAKRALGSLNLIVQRRYQYPRERLRHLIARVDRMEWDYLVITGDIGQLGLAAEFEEARRELAPLLARGPERVAILPGNHDHYVREGGDRANRAGTAFYGVFGEFCPRADGFAARALGGPWWLATWDSTLATPVGSAQGQVRTETMAATERWLAGLPEGARVILANHYPVVFPNSFWPGVYHQLRNLDAVRAWMQRQPIEVLLHGHIHQPWVIAPAGDLNARPSPSPANPAHVSPPGPGVRLSVNSASSSQRVRRAGDPAFHRLTLPLEPGAPVRVEVLAVEPPHAT